MARLTPKHAFDHCAEDYAQYRPTYPAELFGVLADRAGVAAGRWAADVGAGTGIFSRLLADHGWRVVAIEPTESMLQHAGGDSIGQVCATAETTGLAERSVGLVTAAQAFHWFNPPYALAELARILQSGGVLALAWNNRDGTRSKFVEAFEGLVARYNPAYRREYRQQDWPAKIADAGGFEPARYHRFDHVWQLAPEEFVGFTRSVSYIRNVLSRKDRPRFEKELRGLLANHFGQGACAIPLRTDLWTARRR